MSDQKRCECGHIENVHYAQYGHPADYAPCWKRTNGEVCKCKQFKPATHPAGGRDG